MYSIIISVRGIEQESTQNITLETIMYCPYQAQTVLLKLYSSGRTKMLQGGCQTSIAKQLQQLSFHSLYL